MEKLSRPQLLPLALLNDGEKAYDNYCDAISQAIKNGEPIQWVKLSDYKIPVTITVSANNYKK